MVTHMLRWVMGDANFSKLLRNYLTLDLIWLMDMPNK